MLRFALLVLALLPGNSVEAENKVDQTLRALRVPKLCTAPQHFVLTESDLNRFAAEQVHTARSRAVKKIAVGLKKGGTVTTNAVIDMDQVRLTGFPFSTISRLLSGEQKLSAEGMFAVKEGKGHYEIRAARLNEKWLPAWFVTALLANISKRQAPYVDVTEDFALPFGIKEVRVSQGRIEIVR